MRPRGMALLPSPAPETATSPLPAVDVLALVGPYEVDPWLAGLARRAAAPSLGVRAVVVGQIGRYALALVADPRAALATRLGGDVGPAERARGWARGLDSQQRGELVGLTRQVAVCVLEAVDSLREEPSAVAAEAVRAGRDELASLCFLVDSLGDHQMAELVAEVDRAGGQVLDLLGEPRESSPAARLSPVPWWA